MEFEEKFKFLVEAADWLAQLKRTAGLGPSVRRSENADQTFPRETVLEHSQLNAMRTQRRKWADGLVVTQGCLA